MLNWCHNEYRQHVQWSVTVISINQFNLIFSMLKKSCKNEYICPSGICISDIITLSRINLIIFSIEDFMSHKKIENYPSIHVIWWNKKNYIHLSNFDRIRKSTLIFLTYYSIESIKHNSFKAYKFLKTGVHGKYVLVSWRAEFI